MKDKLTFGWLVLALGGMLMLSQSRSHVAAAIILFTVAFTMGAVIAASGRLLAGLALLIISMLLPAVLAIARVM